MAHAVALKVTMQTKNKEEGVYYRKPMRDIILPSKTLEDTHFLIQNFKKEVKQLSQKQIKKLKKILKVTIQASVSFLILTNPTLAAGMDTAEFSKELIDLAKWAVFILTVLGVVSAMAFMICAGILRQIRKEKEAKEWTTDIIKGFTQVLVAPIIIGLIFQVVYLLFQDSKWFVSPLNMF